jgi:hypothetical protein
MGRIQPFTPEKLVIATIVSPELPINTVVGALDGEFGDIDYVSRAIPFDFTDYYEPEMGRHLTRFFITIGELVDPAALSDFKLKTDAMERRFCVPSFADGGRREPVGAGRPGADSVTDEKTDERTDESADQRRDRLVNLDPGVLSLSRLILASTKDFSHRIPLRDGIYAEVTLRYSGGDFRNLPWTFPDYRTEDYHAILRQIRSTYREQLRSQDLLQPK